MYILDPQSFRPNETKRFRSWYYLVNSRLDLIDFWLNSIILSIGMYMLIIPEVVDVMSNYYHLFLQIKVNENFIAVMFIFSGTVNLLRIFYSQKLRDVWICLLKHFTFACYLILFFSLFIIKPVPVSGICFLILTFASVASIIKSAP
jgi:hypothetical protein